MNKTQLVATITDALNDVTPEGNEWAKPDVKAVLDTFEEVVVESCRNGDPVTLTGFVKFARVDRKARMGRNPATGESIKIKAKSVAKITALKGFKDAVMAKGRR